MASVVSKPLVYWFIILCLSCSAMFLLWQDAIVEKEWSDVTPNEHAFPTFHYDGAVRQFTKRKNTKIVILAGPHKTGSSSIQSNLWKWTKEGWLGNSSTNMNISTSTLNSPAWVTPNMTCVRQNWVACGEPAWLGLDNQIHKAWNCLGLCLDEKILNSTAPSCSSLSSCYSDSIRDALQEQKIAVFGLEHFATSLVMFKQDNIDPYMYMQRFMEMFHSSGITKEDIRLVVTYRSPRIDQLLSSWKHHRDIEKAYNKTDLTFRSFLMSDFERNKFDSLYATKIIADEFDMDVTLLDTSGIRLAGYDISNVVACEILGSPCHASNRTIMLGGNASIPIRENVRVDNSDLNDLSPEEKSNIESILRKIDCNSIHSIFNHPRVQILYPYLLNETLHSCSNHDRIYTHEQAFQDIRSVVNQSTVTNELKANG